VFGVVVSDSLGQRLFRIQTNETVKGDLPACLSGGQVHCRIPRVMLVPGNYTLTLGLGLHSREQLDHLENVASFSVVEADVFQTGYYPDRRGGVFVSDSEWAFAYK
jgi:hypothetical protein